MRVSFRQGIVRHQTDMVGTPQFLQFDATRNFISLMVVETPTTINFSHREANYLVDEPITITQAWGNLPTVECWLYWDINVVSAGLTRGVTSIRPYYGMEFAGTPVEDQHWYDTVENIMQVFQSGKWVEKIRVFAGTIKNGLLNPFSVGSQSGDETENNAGFILLDPFNNPLKYKNPAEQNHWYARFVTSETWLTVVNQTNLTSKLGIDNLSVMAAEPIPKFHLVKIGPDRRVSLARHSDHTTRVNGLILEDLYKSDVSELFCHGLIANNDWMWAPEQINKPLFCGLHGELMTSAPEQGVYQQIGFVYDTNAIFVDLQPVIILDEITSSLIGGYPILDSKRPISGFSVDVSEGIAPLQVAFTSAAETAETFEWDFQSNGHWDAVGKKVYKLFTEPGTYSVTHRVSNQYGVDTKTFMNVITVSEPPAPTLLPNNKLKLAVVGQVRAGVSFKLRVNVSNIGLGSSTGVVRTIRIRTDTGVDVIGVNLQNSQIRKTGAGIPSNPKITIITLPTVDVSASQSVTVDLELKINSLAKNVIIEGSIISNEDDSDSVNNTATLQIPVRT